MASSNPNNFYFPFYPSPPPSHPFTPPPPPSFKPPPPPSHSFTPPPPPSHLFSPPPPPPRGHPPLPPPPSHPFSPPPPPPHHPVVPPPPHVRPPPSPVPPPPTPNHPTVIIVVIVSMGGLLCLSMLAFALFCWVQKRKKKTEETDIIHIDEHKKIKETIVPGPFGTQTVVISVEDDVHIDEEIKKKTEEGGHHHHGLHVEPSSSSTDQGNSRSADDEVGISKLLHHDHQKHDNDNA